MYAHEERVGGVVQVGDDERVLELAQGARLEGDVDDALRERSDRALVLDDLGRVAVGEAQRAHVARGTHGTERERQRDLGAVAQSEATNERIVDRAIVVELQRLDCQQRRAHESVHLQHECFVACERRRTVAGIVAAHTATTTNEAQGR